MAFEGRLRAAEIIARMIPIPVLTGHVETVSNLVESARAEWNFGSSVREKRPPAGTVPTPGFLLLRSLRNRFAPICVSEIEKTGPQLSFSAEIDSFDAAGGENFSYNSCTGANLNLM
jgi:hypothetical protein